MAKKFGGSGSASKRAGTGTVSPGETPAQKWTGSVAEQVATSSQVKSLLTKTIPVAYVVTDPNNPRKLALSQQQIIDIARRHPSHKELLQTEDPAQWVEDYVATVAEAEHLQGKALGDFESLVGFAASLKSADRLLHPIVVTREDSTFHLIAGERRLLAHILLGESHIAARIQAAEIPRTDIATLQWEENVHRVDMSLWERVDHIRKMIESREGLANMSVTKLSKLLGNSRAESQRYLVILRYPSPLLMEAIRDGKVSDLKQAASLAQLEPEQLAKRFSNIPAAETSKPVIKFQRKAKAKDFGVILQAAAKQLKMGDILAKADLETPAGINDAIELLLAELENRHHG